MLKAHRFTRPATRRLTFSPTQASDGSTAVALTAMPFSLTLGQSLTTWARNVESELTNPIADDANVKIWDHATQQLVNINYGPLAGGGNEQQPGNSWLDAAYQAGTGWLPAFYQTLRASGDARAWGHFGWSIGGSVYSDSSATFGRDANWTPAASGGAYQDFLASWNALKVVLAAQGKYPDAQFLFSDLGISSASYTLGEAQAYQAAHTAMIDQLRSDGVIGANTRVFQMLFPGPITATNKSTIISAQIAMAAADSKIILLNNDGMKQVSGDIHPTASFMEDYGRRIAFEHLNMFHPRKRIKAASHVMFPRRDYFFGAPLATTSGGFVDQAWEAELGGAHMSNTTTVRPAAQNSVLGNGLRRTWAQFDGFDDSLVNAGAAPCFGDSDLVANGFVLCIAFKGTALTNACLYSENNNSNSTALFHLKSDATGKLALTLRNDANVLAYSLQDMGVGTAFDGNWHFVAVTYDNTQFKAYMDGTTGSTLAWTKSAITLNNSAFGATRANGVTGSFMTGGVARCTIATYNAAGVAAYIANMRTLFQMLYGTP